MTTQLLNSQSTPSDPRAGRNGEQSRLSNRGGIQKRGQNKPRLDKDGDAIMDSSSGNRGRGRGTNNRRDTSQPYSRGSTARAHPATSHRSTVHGHPPPPRSTRSTKVDPAAVQKAILRSMGSKDSLPKGPKALSRLTKYAGKDDGKDGATGGLDQIRIYGLNESKAASNPGGGVKDLLNFLERKATAPNAPAKDAVRIRKVCLTVRRFPSSTQASPYLVRSRFMPSLRTTTEIHEPCRFR